MRLTVSPPLGPSLLLGPSPLSPLPMPDLAPLMLLTPPAWLTLTLTVLGYFLTLVLIRWVLLTRKEQPSSTVAWVMLIVLLPYLGGLLFLIFGINRVDRRAKLKAAADRHVDRQLPGVLLAQVLPDEAESELQKIMMRIAGHSGRSLVTSDNSIQILADTNRTFGLIEQAVLNARHSLHLEYYIWQRDKTGTRLRDLLISKAHEGVKIRFLYDAVGSMHLNNRFIAPMREAGIQVASFLAGASFRERWSLNLRNHRKIVVVDGLIGFTGGMNIGNEYLGLDHVFGYWRDSHLRIEGSAVLQLQQTFAEDWYFATGELLVSPKLYPDPGEPGDTLAQVITSGPTGPDNASRLMMFEAINQSRSRIMMTTGYFVPPIELARALEAAAMRGVKVRIIVPGRGGHVWTIFAGRSYYDSLLHAGVEVHEYTRGALHAKTMTVDGEWSYVGSANFDSRSLALNFEAGVAIYDERAAQVIEAQFEQDLQDSLQITKEMWSDRSTWRVLAENSARMFAPIA